MPMFFCTTIQTFKTAEVFTWTSRTSDKIVFQISLSDSLFTMSYSAMKRMHYKIYFLGHVNMYYKHVGLSSYHSPEILSWHRHIKVNVARHFL